MKYDLIIVGSGPAGITASIYASRANKSVLVIEKSAIGGNITHSPKVENYPGLGVISGLDLADKFSQQAMDLNVEFEFDNVLEITKTEHGFIVQCENASFECLSVILATGSKHRTLNLENEEKFVGRGVSYCAVCDGAFSADKDVCMIGGGNSAMQEALLLSNTCTSVTMFQNLPFLTGEPALIKQINESKNIKVLYNKIVVALNGDKELTSITIKDTSTNQEEIYQTTSIFVAIGQQADNEPFKNICTLDTNGFIVSDDNCVTKTEGVFVAGDCRCKKIRQIVTATSDGSIAALQAIKYIDSIKK